MKLCSKMVRSSALCPTLHDLKITLFILRNTGVARKLRYSA